MDWIQSMQKAINYIEDNLMDHINSDEIAQNVYFSSYHFNRIFNMITGVTIGEYIRNRRLSSAGNELYETKAKIIDIALKYGYDTPEGFTKAFSRFHGFAPSDVRKTKKQLKVFNPISITINSIGDDILDYKIEVKNEFIGNKSKKIDNIHVMYNGTWDETINSDFLNSVVAAMHHVDKEIDTVLVVGASGAAFNSYWSFGTNNSCDFMLMGDKLIEKTFQNLGYYHTLYKNVSCDNWKLTAKKKIVESIDNDYPVVVKFHKDIYSVISGYDDNGSIIFGSKCWGDDGDGYFKKENYYDDIDSIIIINSKIDIISKNNINRDILEWCIHMAQLPSFFNYENNRECFNGIACYDEIIKVILDDSLFASDDIDRLRYMCEEIGNNFIMYNCNKRKFTAKFLRKMSSDFEQSRLTDAALEFDKVFELYNIANNIPKSWMPEEQILKIKDATYRNEIAVILSEIKEHENLGISHMKELLLKITPQSEPVKYTPAGL